MKLAIFGATGRSGGAIARQALTAGHEVHALVRTPGSRLDGADVTVGDVRDPAAVDRVIKDADAAVSAIGGTGRDNPALLFDGTANLLAAAHRHHVPRLIVIQGFHLPFPGDPRTIGRPLMVTMLRLWNRHLLADTHRMADLLRSADLDWTLIRMPHLIPAPPVPPGRPAPPVPAPPVPGSPGDGYRTGRLALGPWSTVTTAQVAHFTLAVLEQGGFSHDAPMICSATKRGR